MPILPGWLKPFPRICAVDIGHRTLDELRRAFANVRVRHYWLGMFFIAVAVK
jgi:hypothetical protein